ncbi:FtsB family cell division protein [Orenia marismortui]|uniref:FtsB family cell division protein n=1 Tax=Orenia marismortui TaxID=46469 RepID=UPI00035E28FF|nr:septum formation initiator family protein [Orenia marismortui]
MIKQKQLQNKSKDSSKLVKLKRFIIFALIFCLLSIIYNFYQGYQEKKIMESKIASLEAEIRVLDKSKKDLKEQIEHIHSEGFIERVAREELGLVKKGEILYILVEE